MGPLVSRHHIQGPVPAGLKDFAELFTDADLNLRSYYCQESLRKDRNRSSKQQAFRHLCNELTKRPQSHLGYRLPTVTEEAQELSSLFALDGTQLTSSNTEAEAVHPPVTDVTTWHLVGPKEQARRNILANFPVLDSIASRSSLVATRLSRRARASTARLRARLSKVGGRVKDVTKLKRLDHEEEDEQRLTFALLDSAKSRGVPETKFLVKKLLLPKPKLSEDRNSTDGLFEWVPTKEQVKRDSILLSLGSFRARRSTAPSPAESLREPDTYGILSTIKSWNWNGMRQMGAVDV